MKKQKGSAILIAILLMTAIGGLAFSFGRLLMLEIANSSISTDGISAYYAAESGIEEGFLRYKYDRNSAEPFNWSLTDVNKVYSFNLTSSLCKGNPYIGGCSGVGINKSSVLIDNSVQQFSVRMGSEVKYFGQDVNSTSSVDATDLASNLYPNAEDSDFVTKRDESKKFDMGKMFSTGNVNFYFKPIISTASNTNTSLDLDEYKCVLIEAKIIGKVGTNNLQERKILLKNSDTATCPSQDHSLTEGIYPYTLTGDGVATINSLKNIIWPTDILSQASLFIKPIGADIAFAFAKSGTGNLYGPNSNIVSTGYYGGVTRTLEANIDRQSGSLYDLFDYVMYKYQ